MNKIVLFFALCFFTSNYCLSQSVISPEDKSHVLIIKEKFDKVFVKTLPAKSIQDDKTINKLINEGLDAELEIIDFLSSKFSVQSMEKLLESIRTNQKIEKIANHLFQQIEYVTNKIEKELKKGSK